MALIFKGIGWSLAVKSKTPFDPTSRVKSSRFSFALVIHFSIITYYYFVYVILWIIVSGT